MMPGKQDATKSGGELKQTRILNDYLSSLHENIDMKCSFAQFCKLRPRHVRLTSLIPRNTCLCRIHQNMALKLKCLKMNNIHISPNPEIVSRTYNENQFSALLAGLTEETITFESWQRVDCSDGKKRMKIVKTLPVSDFTEKVKAEFKQFLDHVSRVKAQYHSVSELKKKLPPGHIMDFAENFACQSLDEIQSAYWNATAVSLHAVVIYFRDNSGDLKHRNIVFVSDVLSHNATAVVTILQKLLPIVKNEIPNAVKIHYWTDSPTSQYRNRSIFDILCRHGELFGLHGVWNYFESGHGKGPCDGIGDVAKRQASEAVRQGKVNIQDAADFYKWAQSRDQSSIKYVFYTADDYNYAASVLNERSPSPVSGTMKAQAVVPISPTEVCLNTTSCYCSLCLEGTLCPVGWERRTLISQQAVDSGMSSGAVNAYPDNTYIAATYQGRWYVAKVLDHDDNEIHFMEESQAKTGTTYKWPNPEDDLWVTRNSILCSIEAPMPLGRSQRSFKLSDAASVAINGALDTHVCQ